MECGATEPATFNTGSPQSRGAQLDSSKVAARYYASVEQARTKDGERNENNRQ